MAEQAVAQVRTTREQQVAPRSSVRYFWRQFRRNRLAVAGGVILILL